MPVTDAPTRPDADEPASPPDPPTPAPSGPSGQAPGGPPDHSSAFRLRRFFNWFPMGLAYAFLYMGRYNLTVSKNALGDLMTKEDFGVIFGVGTVVYAVAFLLNGPMTDRFGGRRAMLVAATGAGVMNVIMGLYLQHVVGLGTVNNAELRTVFSLLYAGNMYFQSFGAVAIVKVNAHWFHVRERGGFSGIFGTMISSGIFFAFSVNNWLLDMFTAGAAGSSRALQTKWVFFVPGALLLTMAVIESFLLKDKPSQAGLQDFDTGDASSGAKGDVPTLVLMKRILTNPIILTVALIEFCTGVLRNGVMHWYPIFVNEVLSLPSKHPLNNGSWGSWTTIVPFFVVAAVLFVGASLTKGHRRGMLTVSGGLVFLVPFLQGGWGGILMVAGIIGGNVAGFISDLFFNSRRAPAAGGLYVVLFLGTIVMGFSLGEATSTISDTKIEGLAAGDRVVAVAGKPVADWVAVKRAFACVPAECAQGATFDAGRCVCSSKPSAPAPAPADRGTISLDVERGGQVHAVKVPDPAYKRAGAELAPKMRAGDTRKLDARPVLTLSPYVLAAVVFVISLCVIGTHGLLSGTATMDFGGRQGAATAVAMIDGFVYLGTAVQSFALGQLTSISWAYWPWFLTPFALIGFLLSLRIWNAKPGGSGGH
jgi:MFS transporter, OPA family, glycerol-3-phosphate transporter